MTVRCEAYDCINNDEGYCVKDRIDLWAGGVCGDYEPQALSEEDEQEWCLYKI